MQSMSVWKPFPKPKTYVSVRHRRLFGDLEHYERKLPSRLASSSVGDSNNSSISVVFSLAGTRQYNPLSLGRQVSLLVPHTLLFWCVQAVFALLLLPNWLVNFFHYCPCPPARSLGSRVSGLVLNPCQLPLLNQQYVTLEWFQHPQLVLFLAFEGSSEPQIEHLEAVVTSGSALHEQRLENASTGLRKRKSAVNLQGWNRQFLVTNVGTQEDRSRNKQIVGEDMGQNRRQD